MAQDSGSQPGGKQAEVDIDELEVEILILAKSAKGLHPASAFLTRRGWPTTIMTNLSKGIEYIAEKRPDFVLVSLNHPSPAVFKLPDLITQTFNIISIGFMETSDAMSTQKLNQVKLRYKIFGAPSGPNFQRSIRRILAEKFNVKLDERGAPEEHKADKGAGSVTVRGGKKQPELGSLVDGMKPTNEGPQLFRGQKVGEPNKGYVPTAGSTEQKNRSFLGGIYQAAGEPAAPGGIVAQGPAAGEAIDAAFTADDFAKEMQIAEQSGVGVAKQNETILGPSLDEEMAATQSAAGEEASDGKYSTNKKPRKRLKQLTGSNPDRDVGGNLLFGRDMDPNKPAAAPAAAPGVDLVGMLKKSLFGELGVDSAETTGQSVLEKAVESGLGQVCRGNPQLAPIPIRKVTRAAVFPVDSGSMPGYLVVALETIPSDDQSKFLKDCEHSLLTAFQQMGVAGKLEGGFWLDLPDVPFDPWAGHSSTFTFKLDHDGAQVGVAFFGSETPLPKARVEAESGMYTLDVDSISTEQPINFKAYLHLSKNRKYFLYLRNGRRLSPEQKQRLKEKQVKEIFMKSVDLENVRMFLASVFLHQSIKTSQEAA